MHEWVLRAELWKMFLLRAHVLYNNEKNQLQKIEI